MSLLKRFLYLKLCFNRAYSHFAVPLGLFNTAILLSVLLSQHGISVKYVLPGTLVVTLVLHLIIGHYDLQKGIFAQETSLNNEHNPEIKELLKK